MIRLRLAKKTCFHPHAFPGCKPHRNVAATKDSHSRGRGRKDLSPLTTARRLARARGAHSKRCSPHQGFAADGCWFGPGGVCSQNSQEASCPGTHVRHKQPARPSRGSGLPSTSAFTVVPRTDIGPARGSCRRSRCVPTLFMCRVRQHRKAKEDIPHGSSLLLAARRSDRVRIHPQHLDIRFRFGCRGPALSG